MSRGSRAMTVAAFALAGSLVSNAQEKDILGAPAPDFELSTIEGGNMNLKSLRGKVVVLDFWAVWCGPCEQSMPFFQKLQDEYGKQGLEVVGLHVDDRMPSPKEVQEFLDERSIRYRNLVSTTEVDDKFMIYAMPTTYLIDRKGVVRKRHVGFNPATAPARVETDVQALLAAR